MRVAPPARPPGSRRPRRRGGGAGRRLAAGRACRRRPPPPRRPPPTPVVDGSLARSPELSETSRLEERRALVTGDRAWAMGTADGRYPAAGFHTRGEMGGVLAAEPQAPRRHVVRHRRRLDRPGHQDHLRLGLRPHRPARDRGVAASRTDVVPDGQDGALVGLSLRSDTDRTITLKADAHSELMGPTPGARPRPARRTSTSPDTAAVASGTCCLRRPGHAAAPQRREPRLGAPPSAPTLTPTGHRDRHGLPRPAGPRGHLPGLRPGRPAAAGALRRHGVRQRRRRPADLRGHAAGRRGPHRLVRRRRLHPQPRAGPRRPRRRARRPAQGALAARWPPAATVDRPTAVDLPGDRLLQQSVRWSKQMLAASDQRVEDPKLPGRQRRQGLPASRRAPSTRCAGSAPAGPTTRGCSAPTASTPRTPPSPPASSPRSRRTCGRCVTCPW